MPYFEMKGHIFETEYGPITEMDVFEAIDDMTAMYILSEGDFSDVRIRAAEDKIVAHAHDVFERQVNSALGIGLGISSLVPAPMGAPVRKAVGLFAGGVRLVTGSKTVDAEMRRRVKHELKREVAKQQERERRRNQGR